MTLQRPTKPPSHRQLQIAKLIAFGYDYKQIGVKLKISHRTVRHYTEQLASTIPLGDEGEFPEVFTPYARVQTWAFWELRVLPTLDQAA